MQKTTGAIFFDGQLGTVTGELPELTPGQVLVEVHASLISPGSEMGLARMFRKSPAEKSRTALTFGYSNAGVIL